MSIFANDAGGPGAGRVHPDWVGASGAFDFSSTFIFRSLFSKFPDFPPASQFLNFNLQTCNLQTLQHLTVPFE
jgi:hypothetical protein